MKINVVEQLEEMCIQSAPYNTLLQIVRVNFPDSVEWDEESYVDYEGCICFVSETSDGTSNVTLLTGNEDESDQIMFLSLEECDDVLFVKVLSVGTKLELEI